jgi:hypothetical protein
VKVLRLRDRGSRSEELGFRGWEPNGITSSNPTSPSPHAVDPKVHQSTNSKLDPSSYLLDPIPYIEATLSDIETANKLVNEILGKSLDELTPQTRKFLERLTEMVHEHCKIEDMEQSAYRFNRKEAREYTGWSNFQVKKHIDRLVEMEYIIAHRGKRGQSFVYELLYQEEGLKGIPFMMGLIAVDSLQETTIDQGFDKKNEPLNEGFEPPLSPH